MSPWQLLQVQICHTMPSQNSIQIYFCYSWDCIICYWWWWFRPIKGWQGYWWGCGSLILSFKSSVLGGFTRSKSPETFWVVLVLGWWVCLDVNLALGAIFPSAFTNTPTGQCRIFSIREKWGWVKETFCIKTQQSSLNIKVSVSSRYWDSETVSASSRHWDSEEKSLGLVSTLRFRRKKSRFRLNIETHEKKSLGLVSKLRLRKTSWGWAVPSSAQLRLVTTSLELCTSWGCLLSQSG